MHRDIKPENIIFRNPSKDSVVITDFGLATKIDENYNIKSGTLGYMAPEILNLKHPQDKYDESCDIFSVGIIFFEL